MYRIDRLLEQLCEEQDTMTHNLGHNAPVVIGAQGRRDALRDLIADEWRAMVEALEKQAICQPYHQTCASCVNRARAILARTKGGE